MSQSLGFRVYLESLGCKLNQCERDMLARQFVDAGCQIVSRVDDADLCIINTCAVTQTAAGKSRRRVRRLRRLNPSASVVVTGCYATLDSDNMDADLIVPNAQKQNLVALVAQNVFVQHREAFTSPCYSKAILPRTRPMVKIQDGCDNACSYCIVHVLRGPQSSRPRKEILAEISNLVRCGYHEIVLTGVHVGAYGRDISDTLVGLVEDVLLLPELPERIRLSSIEPWDIPVGFFELWQDDHLCRHLHLPLQSGCTATLQRMNRNYTTAQFADLVTQARTAIPGLAITTDVIVGFPGETDTEFSESLNFVESMGFARAHIFPYSPRPGTPAAEMPGQVEFQLCRERARKMTAVTRRSGDAFRQSLLGQTESVLWERQQQDGNWSGLTDTYVRVFASSDQDLTNILHLTHLIELKDGGVFGRLAPKSDLKCQS